MGTFLLYVMCSNRYEPLLLSPGKKEWSHLKEEKKLQESKTLFVNRGHLPETEIVLLPDAFCPLGSQTPEVPWGVGGVAMF